MGMYKKYLVTGGIFIANLIWIYLYFASIKFKIIYKELLGEKWLQQNMTDIIFNDWLILSMVTISFILLIYYLFFRSKEKNLKNDIQKIVLQAFLGLNLILIPVSTYLMFSPLNVIISRVGP
jgi:hypothetical protein